jgi:ribonucleoside-triphosphate reductase
MISSQRSLIYGQLNKELYQKFFLNKEELQAAEDGYIYINDMKDRLDGINCCLFDVGGVLKGGFEMGNIWYNEPKTVDTAFDVIGDIVLSAASQQYGGFTIPQVDDILSPYAEKSYQKYFKKYHNMATSTQRKTLRAAGINMADLDQVQLNAIYELASEDAKMNAEADVRRDIEQGFQGWEYKFNTVGSSRGDYPFIAMSFGINTSKWGLIISEIALDVRRDGQGKDGFKKPVLFPKLTFLYDDNLHGDGKAYEYLFDKAVLCSSKTMYPDYLSLTGEGYIANIYKKYGKVISLMGKRKLQLMLNLLNTARWCGASC